MIILTAIGGLTIVGIQHADLLHHISTETIMAAAPDWLNQFAAKYFMF